MTGFERVGAAGGSGSHPSASVEAAWWRFRSNGAMSAIEASVPLPGALDRTTADLPFTDAPQLGRYEFKIRLMLYLR